MFLLLVLVMNGSASRPAVQRASRPGRGARIADIGIEGYRIDSKTRAAAARTGDAPVAPILMIGAEADRSSRRQERRGLS
ncbi:hypothetical protein DWV00_06460 [Trinickia dinghuensis]|uniref:Uncharacterized protein n=1 Tax=Trinickia dinghuensis TaxID=2291023 RepID=A0A3D8K4B3_9BURK|nr:hypothetical protein DWV00_06460 [Trinickia dinghuensis]